MENRKMFSLENRKMFSCTFQTCTAWPWLFRRCSCGTLQQASRAVSLPRCRHRRAAAKLAAATALPPSR
jgi:hypothetical protein